MAVLFPCKTLFTIWTQAGQRQGLGLLEGQLSPCDQEARKTRNSFPAFPSLEQHLLSLFHPSGRGEIAYEKGFTLLL